MRDRTRSITRLALCGLLLSGAALPTARAAGGAPSQGASMDPTQLREYLASENLYTPAEIKRELDRVKVRPLDNPALAFEILVPRGWESRSIKVSDADLLADGDRPVPLVEMAPRGSKDVVLEVRYMRVAKEVTLERFLLTYARSSGMTVVGRQRGAFNGRQVEEALLRMEDPRLGAFLVRMTVSRRGDRIFLVACSAREAAFARWRRPFGAAVVSFAPLQP